MPLGECQVQIRDLVLGPGTVYRILSGTNFFSRSVRADTSGPRAWNHGAWSGAEWQEQAVVPLQILVDTDSPAEWLAAHQNLAAAFAPIGEAVADVELRFEMAGREYILRGRPRMVEPDMTLLGTGRTMTRAAFVALDPLIYSGSEAVAGPVSLATFEGGLVIPREPGIVSESTATEQSGESLTVPLPDGWVPGQVALLIAGMNSDTPAFNAPGGGWNLLDSTPLTVGSSKVIVAWKELAEAESDPTVTLTPGSLNKISGAILTLRNAHPTTPIGVVGTRVVRGASSTQTVAPSIVTTIDGQLLLGLYEEKSSTSTTVAVPGMTQQAAAFTTGGGAVSTAIFSERRPTAGATGTRTATYDVASGVGYGILLAVNGAGGLTVPFTVNAVANGGSAVLTNEGTADTGLLLRIDGPLDQPMVSLKYADGSVKTLRFGINLLAGQFLEVDTAARTVLFDGISSRRGQTSGDFMLLAPGTHTLQLRAASGAGTLTATYRSAWW